MNILEFYEMLNNPSNLLEDIQICNHVFVYGTLKKGHGNNSLLKNSNFLGKAVSVSDTYEMYCNGGFPMTIDTSKHNYKISGELYEIDEHVLSRLDMLESNGQLYTREIRYFVNKDTNKKERAWVYLYNDNPKKYGTINLNIEFFLDNDGKKIIEWKRKPINYL